MTKDAGFCVDDIVEFAIAQRMDGPIKRIKHDQRGRGVRTP